MLISIEKQQEIKQVSVNNLVLINRIIKETEELELNVLFGTVFYQDIVTNYNTEIDNDYKKLVEGCTFVDNNGNNITHNGLWYLLAYLNFAEYILESSIQDTFTGFVTKQRGDSESISSAMLKNLRNKNREIGFNYFNNTRMFLEQNINSFPLYNKKEKRVTNFKISSIKKTIN